MEPRGLRALVPPTALLLAAALVPLLAMLPLGAAPGSVPPAPPPQPGPGGGAATCRAAGIAIEAGLEGDTLLVRLQPPNPCYQVLDVFVAPEPGEPYTVSLEARIRGPDPGTVCIQVLPPPVVVEAQLPGYHGGPVSLVATVRDEASGCVETCSVVVKP